MVSLSTNDLALHFTSRVATSDVAVCLLRDSFDANLAKFRAGVASFHNRFGRHPFDAPPAASSSSGASQDGGSGTSPTARDAADAPAFSTTTTACGGYDFSYDRFVLGQISQRRAAIATRKALHQMFLTATIANEVVSPVATEEETARAALQQQEQAGAVECGVALALCTSTEQPHARTAIENEEVTERAALLQACTAQGRAIGAILTGGAALRGQAWNEKREMLSDAAGEADGLFAQFYSDKLDLEERLATRKLKAVDVPIAAPPRPAAMALAGAAPQHYQQGRTALPPSALASTSNGATVAFGGVAVYGTPTVPAAVAQSRPAVSSFPSPAADATAAAPSGIPAAAAAQSHADPFDFMGAPPPPRPASVTESAATTADTALRASGTGAAVPPLYGASQEASRGPQPPGPGAPPGSALLGSPTPSQDEWVVLPEAVTSTPHDTTGAPPRAGDTAEVGSSAPVPLAAAPYDFLPKVPGRSSESQYPTAGMPSPSAATPPQPTASPYGFLPPQANTAPQQQHQQQQPQQPVPIYGTVMPGPAGPQQQPQQQPRYPPHPYGPPPPTLPQQQQEVPAPFGYPPPAPQHNPYAPYTSYPPPTPQQQQPQPHMMYYQHQQQQQQQQRYPTAAQYPPHQQPAYQMQQQQHPAGSGYAQQQMPYQQQQQAVYGNVAPPTNSQYPGAAYRAGSGAPSLGFPMQQQQQLAAQVQQRPVAPPQQQQQQQQRKGFLSRLFS